MNVKELRETLAHYPDDTIVIVNAESNELANGCECRHVELLKVNRYRPCTDDDRYPHPWHVEYFDVVERDEEYEYTSAVNINA